MRMGMYCGYLLVCLLPQVLTVCVTDSHPLEGIEITENSLAERVWWDRFGTASGDFSCFAPNLAKLSPGWRVLGHLAQPNHKALGSRLLAFRDCVQDGGSLPALADPVGYTKIWDDSGTTHLQDGSVWTANCPRGYARLSDFFYPSNDADVPTGLIGKVSCIREDLAEECSVGEQVWKFKFLGLKSVSVWNIKPTGSTEGGPFLHANRVVDRPPAVGIRCIKKSSFALV